MIADSVTTNAKRRFMQRRLRLIFCDSSVSCEVANDLLASGLRWSSNACDAVFNGRRSGHARIAAASFHFPVPIVAFDRGLQVGSIKCRK